MPPGPHGLNGIKYLNVFVIDVTKVLLKFRKPKEMHAKRMNRPYLLRQNRFR